MDILKNKYFKFSLTAVLYTLWVIWLGNYWWLFGLPVIFDYYVTKKVNWTFWKKRDEKNSTVVEWIDALIFAVVAVSFINIFFFQNYKIPTGSMEKSLLIGDHLYVSKLAYGPKIPNTPLSFPFAQHTMPLTKKTKSYLEWIKLDYKRLAGFDEVENDDIVVFNFPAGDTVVVEMSAQSYYSIIRGYAQQLEFQHKREGQARDKQYYYNQARDYVWKQYNVVTHPIDRRDNYIKRCVAIHGDTLKITDGEVFINGRPQQDVENLQYSYIIKTNGTLINPKALERLGIAKDDIARYSATDYLIPLTREMAETIRSFNNVISVESNMQPTGEYSPRVFPHNPAYKWNEDNFGPLWIPEKGTTVPLSLDNLPLYERIIEAYEVNTLEIKDSTIYINGEVANSYTFKMDYYFMMGDNRHSSADSRFWGFVPEDHIVGRPVFVWLSLDKDKKFLSKIRWNRFFMNATE